MALSRRGFLAASAGAVASRAVPVTLKARRPRIIVKLVYDKSLGMMRAIERVIP